MKLKILLSSISFLLLFNLPAAKSQNYQTVNSGRVGFYKAEPYFGNYQLEDNIQAVKIDSVEANSSGDSVFYFYRMIRDTSNYYVGECILDTMASCWMGTHALIKPNGDNFFFNREGDTILIKTQAKLGDSWILLRQSDFYYTATLDSIVYSTISGTNDSVKVISLQAFNNSGSPFPYWYNQKTFRISKNHRFSSMYCLYDFPTDTNVYEPYTYEPLTIGKVYDFEVSDIFHFENGSYLGGPPQYKVVTILSKWHSIGNDTIYYKQLEKKYINELVWNPNPHVISTSKTDTVTVSYSNPDSLLSSMMPHQKVKSSVWDLGYYALSSLLNNWNDRPTMTFDYSNMYKFDTGLNCYTRAFEPIYDYHSFTKGCGASYTFQEAPADFSGFYNKLVYYIKGSEVWGDPYILTSVNEIPNEGLLLEANPNPFTDQIEVRFETKTSGHVSLYLYSITGKLLIKIEDSSKQPGIYTYHPDLAGVAKGIYILKYGSGENISYKKLIKN